MAYAPKLKFHNKGVSKLSFHKNLVQIIQVGNNLNMRNREMSFQQLKWCTLLFPPFIIYLDCNSLVASWPPGLLRWTASWSCSSSWVCWASYCIFSLPPLPWIYNAGRHREVQSHLLWSHIKPKDIMTVKVTHWFLAPSQSSVKPCTPPL